MDTEIHSENMGSHKTEDFPDVLSSVLHASPNTNQNQKENNILNIDNTTETEINSLPIIHDEGSLTSGVHDEMISEKDGTTAPISNEIYSNNILLKVSHIPSVNGNNENSFEEQSMVELSRYSFGTNDQFYLQGCKWSPDYTCILTAVNKKGMHIMDLPLDLYNMDIMVTERPVDILQSVVTTKENGTVYDYCWFPLMNSSIPASCCWIVTQQHGPIQMFDAFDGALRCTYRGYDTVDEVEAALSVCFSADGGSIFGGYRKSLKVFRTDLPGRDFENFTLRTPASCLAVHSTQENLLAIGSWATTINIHDLRTPKLEFSNRFGKVHTGGVTQMLFSLDGNRLFSGARRDGQLVCWDIRYSAVPIFELKRTVATNQRIHFDISRQGRWLVSGDTNGLLHCWDLMSSNLTEFQFGVHNDCCNGVSLHPVKPILATTSGQHHFDETTMIDRIAPAKSKENSIIFWWYGRSEIEKT